MKNILLSCILLTIGQVLFAQNAFYCANQYCSYPSSVADASQVNIYTTHQFNEAMQDATNDLSNVSGFRLEQSPALQAASAYLSTPTDFSTNLIVGTSEFLADEFKKGITTTYINKLKAKLSENEEFEAFMPSTVEYFGEADLFNYGELGGELKAAFEDDLSSLPENFIDYFDSRSGTDMFLGTQVQNITSRQEFCALYMASVLGSRVSRGENLPTSLSYLDQKMERYRSTCTSYYNSIHLISILQQSIRKYHQQVSGQSDADYKNVWISLQEWNSLMAQTDGPTHFEGFLYEANTAFFNRNPTYLSHVRSAIPQLLTVLNGIDNIYAKGQPDRFDAYAILEDIVELLEVVNNEFTLGLEATIVNGCGNPDSEGLSVLDMANEVMDIYKSVADRQYLRVIPKGSKLLTHVLCDAGANINDLLELIHTVTELGEFGSEVANAESSEDVKLAIKNHVTSFNFQDKRMKRWSLTLTGHVGFMTGLEKFQGQSNRFLAPGITAPVSLEITRGFWCSNQHENMSMGELKRRNSRKKYLLIGEDVSEKWRQPHGSYMSLSFGIFDLGAIVGLHLDESVNELATNISYSQVFSPSVYMGYGLKNTGLVLAVGAQYTPVLKEVNSAGTTLGNNSLRIGIRAAWDIPLVKIAARDRMR